MSILGGDLVDGMIEANAVPEEMVRAAHTAYWLGHDRIRVRHAFTASESEATVSTTVEVMVVLLLCASCGQKPGPDVVCPEGLIGARGVLRTWTHEIAGEEGHDPGNLH